MKICSIRIDSIKPDPAQPRRNLKKRSIEAMAKSINEVGLLQPVIVRRSNGGYLLVAGERRLQGSRRMGHEEIPAVVMGEGDYSIRQVQLVENIQREDLDPLERAIAVNEYLKEENLTKSAAAMKLGIARTTLTDWLAILDVSEKYRKLVVDNFYDGPSPVTVSHISVARGLSQKLNDPTLQNDVLEASVKHNLSRGEVRALAESIKQFPGLTAEEAARRLRRDEEEVTEKKKSARKKDVADTIQQVAADIEKSLKALGGILEDPKKFATTEKKEEILESLVKIHSLISRTIPRRFDMDVDRAREKLKSKFFNNILENSGHN